MGQVLRQYWPKRTRLEDERDEINSKPMDERTLSDWLRLVEIERELDPWGGHLMPYNVGACRSAPVRLACVEGRIEASVCCTPPFHSLKL